MRLVIIRYDAADQVSLASSETFADAEALRLEIVRLLSDGLLDPEGDYRVVDLDAASPLVVMVAPVPASADDVHEEPRSEADAFFSAELPEPPVAVVAEADESVVAVEEPFASGVLGDLAAEDAAPAEEPEAAPEDPAQQWPWDLPGADADADDATPEGEDAAPAEEDPVEPEVGPAVEEAEDADPEQAIEEDPALNDDLAAVAASLAEKMSEEPSLVSEPIRLGDDVADAPADEGVVLIDVEIDDDGLEELAVAEPQSVLDAEADPPAGDGEEPDRVYEPGALNMEEYTCNDCVYVNTCPNQHQKKPAECGSFQWKSV